VNTIKAAKYLFVPERGLSRATGGNVVLNCFHRPETELMFVAEEYHKAAKILLDKGLTDLAAYPVVYLYRHAFELSVKSVLIFGKELRIVSLADPFEHRHRLLPLLPHLRQLFNARHMRDYEKLDEIVKELDEVDDFRYTVKVDGSPSIETGFTFSVTRMAEVLDPMLEKLSAIWYGMWAQFENQCEN
jgi:hypothetical protein